VPTTTTIQLSRATGEDLATSAQIAGSTLRAFNIDASEMNRIADVMAKSFNDSALGLSDFGEAIKYVAPVAANANITLEQTTAMLEVLADAGIKGSMAGTSLRKIISDLGQGAGPILTQKLKEMAAAGLSGAQAMDEVGRTAYASLLILSKNTQKIDDNTASLIKSKGALEAVANEVKDNLLGDWDKLGAGFDSSIQKGGDLTKILRAIVQTFTPISDPVKLLNKELKTFGGRADEIDRLKKKLIELRAEIGKPITFEGTVLQRTKDIIDEINKNGNTSSSFQSTSQRDKTRLSVEKEKTDAILRFTQALSELKPKLETEAYLKEKIKALNDKALDQVGRMRAATNDEITLINQKIKALQELSNKEQLGRPSFKANLGSVAPLQTDIGGSIERMRAATQAINDKAFADSNAAKASRDHNDSIIKLGSTVATFGSELGNALGAAAAGTQPFAQSMANMAKSVVQSIQRIALAKMIENAMSKEGKFGAIAGIAAASVGFGLLNALFSKIGSGGGGSGGGSSSGGSSQPRAADSFRPQPVTIVLQGELRANGQDMAYTLRKQDYYQKLRG
jgi:hypothetical protein